MENETKPSNLYKILGGVALYGAYWGGLACASAQVAPPDSDVFLKTFACIHGFGITMAAALAFVTYGRDAIMDAGMRYQASQDITDRLRRSSEE